MGKFCNTLPYLTFIPYLGLGSQLLHFLFKYIQYSIVTMSRRPLLRSVSVMELNGQEGLR